MTVEVDLGASGEYCSSQAGLHIDTLFDTCGYNVGVESVVSVELEDVAVSGCGIDGLL